MKPAYLEVPNNGRDRWMVSYVDIMTILLILFVALAAQALQSVPKKPIPALTPAPAPAPPIPERNTGMAAIKQELERHRLNVKLDARGVVVSLPQALLFPPGEDRINAEALATVSAIGEVLAKIPNNVSLVGHADAVPIHNRRFSNNWELASARGLRLLQLLSTRHGIAESRLSVESYGSNAPKGTNDTPDGRAGNRRVEIVILNSAPHEML